MSFLCYDFQKWTILTMLAILTVCLVAMVNLVYGQTANISISDSLQILKRVLGDIKIIKDYCYEHPDSLNPVQDLKDKGLVFSVLNSTSTTIISGTTITCGVFEQAIEQMKKQMKNKFEHLGDEINDRINKIKM